MRSLLAVGHAVVRARTRRCATRVPILRVVATTGIGLIPASYDRRWLSRVREYIHYVTFLGGDGPVSTSYARWDTQNQHGCAALDEPNKLMVQDDAPTRGHGYGERGLHPKRDGDDR